MDPTLLLKPAEAAAHLRVNVRTVYRLINDGHLPKVHIGEARATRIRRSDLDAYIKQSAA
jgi:excisionase family DNA binding protein